MKTKDPFQAGVEWMADANPPTGLEPKDLLAQLWLEVVGGDEAGQRGFTTEQEIAEFTKGALSVWRLTAR